MGSFGTPTVLGSHRLDRLKMVTFSCAGSASYATGGDTMDLSSTTLGSALGFKKRVDGVSLIGLTNGGGANSKYDCRYIQAASQAPATGVVKIHDQSQAADAEVTNATNLSAVTFVFVAYGE